MLPPALPPALPDDKPGTAEVESLRGLNGPAQGVATYRQWALETQTRRVPKARCAADYTKKSLHWTTKPNPKRYDSVPNLETDIKLSITPNDAPFRLPLSKPRRVPGLANIASFAC